MWYQDTGGQQHGGLAQGEGTGGVHGGGGGAAGGLGEEGGDEDREGLAGQTEQAHDGGKDGAQQVHQAGGLEDVHQSVAQDHGGGDIFNADLEATDTAL